MTDAPTSPELDGADALEELADVVWAQRNVLELLLLKVVTTTLLLAAGERRFLARALDEVEEVTDRLRQLQPRRAAALLPVAITWRTTPGALPLGRLATDAPEPMATVFADLSSDLATLAAEIEAAAAECRRSAASALRDPHGCIVVDDEGWVDVVDAHLRIVGERIRGIGVEAGAVLLPRHEAPPRAAPGSTTPVQTLPGTRPT